MKKCCRQNYYTVRGSLKESRNQKNEKTVGANLGRDQSNSSPFTKQRLFDDACNAAPDGMGHQQHARHAHTDEPDILHNSRNRLPIVQHAQPTKGLQHHLRHYYTLKQIPTATHHPSPSKCRKHLCQCSDLPPLNLLDATTCLPTVIFPGQI